MNVRTPYDGVWRKRLDALNSVWPEFLAGETEALHKARVASRRIREALPVVGASAPPAKVKKLRRKVRQLTRYLGPIRELDVELAMIEREATADGVPRSALSVVRREVAARRQALRERLKKDRPIQDLKKLLKKLEKVAEAKGKGQGERGNGQEPRDKGQGIRDKGRGSRGKGRGETEYEIQWRAALAASLLRRSKKLKAALEDAGPLYAPERIHGVRVAIKKLRYALEIANDAGEKSVRPLLKVLKREQERLGHLHDLQSLLKHVREAEASPRVGTRLADLTAYADTLERECRQLHAEFVEARDLMFECVQEVRRALVPSLSTTHVRPARASTVRPRRTRMASAHRAR